MPRLGYLANVLAVPPLIFRFQFHPELLSEKKSFEYHDDLDFGKWGFDKTKASQKDGQSHLAAAAAGAGGFFADLSEFGPLITATKGQRPGSGKPRSFALEFALDARPKPGDPALVGSAEDLGRIEPALAVLRSFMNPGFDLLQEVAAGFEKPWTRPPTCLLRLGDIDLTCVMNDLNIKITKFKPDLTPERAEISLTLSEQTASLSTSLDALNRGWEVLKSFDRVSANEALDLTPVVGSLKNVFD